MNGEVTKTNIQRKNDIQKKSKSLNQKDNLFDILQTQEDKVIEIQRKDIPEDAMNFFEGCSERFILPEEYKENNFEKYRYIDHDGYRTYLAMQEKGEGEGKEKDIYLYEIDNKGKNIGHGEIRLGITENTYFKDKPFVGFTKTEEDFVHQGYGGKRIITMNNICKQIRGLPLHSSTLLSHNAKKIRENFESQGIAKKYQEADENNRDRFHFL